MPGPPPAFAVLISLFLPALPVRARDPSVRDDPVRHGRVEKRDKRQRYTHTVQHQPPAVHVVRQASRSA